MSTSYAPLTGLPRERASAFDPPPVYRRLRATEPVSPLTFPDGRAGWLVTRYDDVRALLADPRMSSRRSLGANPIRLVPEELKPFLQPRPGQFIGLDPPEHTRYRRLLTGQFTVRRMNALQPRVTEIVDEHLRAMKDAGAPADLVSSFALPVPSLVICELLGVPYLDRAQFQQHSTTLFSLDSSAAEATAAMDELTTYLLDLIRTKRTVAQDDLLSRLARSGEVSDIELAGA